jgi:hypothetical protein
LPFRLVPWRGDKAEAAADFAGLEARLLRITFEAAEAAFLRVVFA